MTNRTTVTKYVCDDGTLFDSELECDQYEERQRTMWDNPPPAGTIDRALFDQALCLRDKLREKLLEGNPWLALQGGVYPERMGESR